MNFENFIRKSLVGLKKAINKPVHVSVAGVIVEKEGKILLVEEVSDVIPKIFEKWNFPMARIKKGEKPYKCAMRSGRKETGLFLKIDNSIRPSRKKNTYQIKIGKVHFNIHLFEATVVKGELKVKPNTLGVQFFSLGEIEELDKDGQLIHHYVLSAIADYKRMVSRRKPEKEGIEPNLKGEK